MRNLIRKVLKESEEEFGWVGDIIKQEPIKVGDVFYVVDTNISMDAHPLDYKPENVRYLFFVTDIYEGSDSFELEYRNCDPKDISYDPKDYNPTNPRCHYDDGDGYYTDIEYKDALNLIDQKYWRPMGNNGYYNHLTESEEEFGWVGDIIDDGVSLSPGSFYWYYRDKPFVKSFIAEKLSNEFNDIRVDGDRIILTNVDWCDLIKFFRDDRGGDGYINRDLAEAMLCNEDDDWWNDYGVRDLVSRGEWKDKIWNDLVMENKKLLDEILSYIKKHYVVDDYYNPKQLDIYGNLPTKKRVIKIDDRVLNNEFFNELKNDPDLLGDLIDEDDEFEDLRDELLYAYGSAYNQASKDNVWKDCLDSIREFLGGEGKWQSKKVVKNGKETTQHFLEFDITELFWSSVFSYFDDCYDDCRGSSEFSVEELDENCEECSTPGYNYSYFVDFLSEKLYNDNDLLNPRYREWPDDDIVTEYFYEDVLHRI